MSQRASSFLIGLCIGGAAACGWKLAAVVWGWPWGVEVAASLVLGGTFTAPALEWATDVLLDTRARWLNPQAVYADGAYAGADEAPSLAQTQPDYTPAPLPGRSVTPLVGGGLLSEWEQYHYDGLLLTLDHAEAAESLTSTALVPAAFTDGKHWGYWMSVLAASQLCVKVNGVATALPAGRTWAWAKRQVRNGLFEAPDDLGATPPLPPHPFWAGMDYNQKVEKVAKAPLKVVNVDEDN